ncbi:MAG: toll/interleukin-1 receptor domain-containing protein [Bryobacteraceae bacterium]
MAAGDLPVSPRVFLSYAWEDDAYRARVEAFAARLVQDGVDARLDAWHLDGLTIPEFMSREVRNADRLLVLCSPEYQRKVHAMEDGARVTGVGWEQMLVTSAIWNGAKDRAALDVVLFRGAWAKSAPLFISGLGYVDLTRDDTFEVGYRSLLQRILGRGKKPPQLGRPPEGIDAVPVASLRGATKPREFLGKLPAVNTTLIGRDKELTLLDAAWADPKVNVVQVIAPGGTGKTALVDKWFRNHLGEATLFGWSFYSQGSEESRQTSSDPFFAEIVAWFRIEVADGASVFSKAEAVARRLREERVLLILDGVEPLQESNGELRDKALYALLQELRARNAGMVLCSTRIRLVDVPDDAAAVSVDLDNLDPGDGAQYLRFLGVEGSDRELRNASADYGNHALALTLLGTYIKRRGGAISIRHDLRALPLNDKRPGRHARQVMASYFELFDGQPEGDILRAFAYFDRPADPEALRLVLPEGRLDREALGNLHEARLASTGNPAEPVACHPLVRDHFAAVMRETAPDAFRAGHQRLYEYYARQGKDLPETLEEMTPLFHAIYHGCQAGRHSEVGQTVYGERVLRGDEAFLTRKLGAFGTNLSLLAKFFADPWTRPVDGLSPEDHAWMINEAGYGLRAVGRLADAVAPMRAVAELDVGGKEWENAAISHGTLSELLLTLGRIGEAIETARQSVEFADRGRDSKHKVINRTTLADALHQSGDIHGAAAKFAEAEQLQRNSDPECPILYSLRGYRYCDLLLSKGERDAARRRAEQTLPGAEKKAGPLEIALDHLTLARAGDPSHFTQAVDGLRRAGRQDHLPRALLARATPDDLAEVHRIATRSGMLLFLADYHLAMARNGHGREHLSAAARIVVDTGYRRREPDVAELQVLLGAI